MVKAKLWEIKFDGILNSVVVNAPNVSVAIIKGVNDSSEDSRTLKNIVKVELIAVED